MSPRGRSPGSSPARHCANTELLLRTSCPQPLISVALPPALCALLPNTPRLQADEKGRFFLGARGLGAPQTILSRPSTWPTPLPTVGTELPRVLEARGDASVHGDTAMGRGASAPSDEGNHRPVLKAWGPHRTKRSDTRTDVRSITGTGREVALLDTRDGDSQALSDAGSGGCQPSADKLAPGGEPGLHGRAPSPLGLRTGHRVPTAWAVTPPLVYKQPLCALSPSRCEQSPEMVQTRRFRVPDDTAGLPWQTVWDVAVSFKCHSNDTAGISTRPSRGALPTGPGLPVFPAPQSLAAWRGRCGPCRACPARHRAH